MDADFWPRLKDAIDNPTLATTNASGAVPSWPPRLLQSAEESVVKAINIVPFTSGDAPFQVHMNSWANPGAGAGTFNHGTFIGYNVGYHDGTSVITPDRIGWYLALESNFYNTDDSTFGPEFYLEYYNRAGTGGFFRPFYCRLKGADGTTIRGVDWRFSLGTVTGSFAISDDAGPGSQFVVYPQSVMIGRDLMCYVDVGIGTTDIHKTDNWRNITMLGTIGAELCLRAGSGDNTGLVQMHATGMYIGTLTAQKTQFLSSGGVVCALPIAGIANYANNAAALAAGLVAKDLYRIGDTLAIVH